MESYKEKTDQIEIYKKTKISRKILIWFTYFPMKTESC